MPQEGIRYLFKYIRINAIFFRINFAFGHLV
jgi:hypothetical protein